MDDKEIKRKLKDASLYLRDAAKAMPKYPHTALQWVQLAERLMNEVETYVNRPLGEKEG